MSAFSGIPGLLLWIRYVYSTHNTCCFTNQQCDSPACGSGKYDSSVVPGNFVFRIVYVTRITKTLLSRTGRVCAWFADLRVGTGVLCAHIHHCKHVISTNDDGIALLFKSSFMRTLTGVLYRQAIKRILFLFSADRVHELFLHTGRRLGRSRLAKKVVTLLWRYDDSILEQNIVGLAFKNPVGLSAGFDYNADLVDILPSVGFGFNTVGTLTRIAYGGNPPPMLGRLPKSRSLLVNKGFKNNGATKVLEHMSPNDSGAPRGVSIGATNKAYPDFSAMIDDLVAGFRDAERFKNFDYYELNISCPNLLNLANLKEQLGSPSGLRQALDALAKLSLVRPVFIKMPLERSLEELDALVETAKPYAFIKGLIFSNLAKDRTNPMFDAEEVKKAGKGNFSGKPVEDGANKAIRHIYQKYKDRFVLVGVGGVFTAEDAYKKILLGASLVQLITGMVYMGPQQIGTINAGIARLLRRDGFKNVADAVERGERHLTIER